MAILAQYTIRSKQEYIFRTNAMREITGASALIRDAWDLLFDKAEEAGVKVKRIVKAGKPLTDIESVPDDLDGAFSNGIGLVDLFRGGGNETVLIKDKETLRLINAAFTRALLVECPGMIPMVVYVEAKGDYNKDYANLMAKADQEKNRMRLGRDLAMTPFSMFDRKVAQPITHVEYSKDGEEGKNRSVQMSSESWAKWKKTKTDPRITKENALLERIAQSDKEQSLLAVVHADGNNMGVKIRDLLKGKTRYSECVDLMRKFTQATDNAFTGEAKKELDDYANKKREELKKARTEKNVTADEGSSENTRVQDELEIEEKADKYIVRWIVNDGDDATFVCNASSALELTNVYLQAVGKQKGISVGTDNIFEYSSCAGICIFHSHYPFSKAYMLAESACSHAKEKVHASLGQQAKEEAWIDWVYIRSGVQEDVEVLREKQGTADRIARPWKVEGTASDCTIQQMSADSTEGKEATITDVEAFTVNNFDELAEQVYVDCDISRSNIKAVGMAWETSKAEGKRELRRLLWRSPGLEKVFGKFPDEESTMRAMYDLAESFDFWYADKLNEKKKEKTLRKDGNDNA